MISNIEIAILMKVNELAGRYGLKPQDFVATVRSSDETRDTILAYETVPLESSGLQRRHTAMLEAVGADERTSKLEGSEYMILDALDNAIARAPKPRSK